MPKYKEICCVNMTRNSQNFPNKRNWPNSDPLLVSRRILSKNNSSLQLMMIHLIVLKGSCREDTQLEVMNHSLVRRWIRGNTKIGVKVCYHQGRYGVEIMIESLFRDRTCSWFRIVNGINKYVTATSEEIPVASVGDRGTGKPVAKTTPRPTPTFTLSLVSIPYRERKWIDIQPGKFSQVCFEMSKTHDQVTAT